MLLVKLALFVAPDEPITALSVETMCDPAWGYFHAKTAPTTDDDLFVEQCALDTKPPLGFVAALCQSTRD